jgi:hypothetical protein
MNTSFEFTPQATEDMMLKWVAAGCRRLAVRFW